MITSPRIRSRKQPRGVQLPQHSPTASLLSESISSTSARDRRAVSVPEDTIPRGGNSQLPRAFSDDSDNSHRRVRSAGRVVDKRGRVNISSVSLKAGSPPKSASPLSFSTPTSPLRGPLPSSLPHRSRRAAAANALSSPSFSYAPRRSDNFASMKRSFRTNSKQQTEFQHTVSSGGSGSGGGGRRRAESLNDTELQRSKSFDTIRSPPSSNRPRKSPAHKVRAGESHPLPSPRRSSDTAALPRRGASANASRISSPTSASAKKGKSKKKEDIAKSGVVTKASDAPNSADNDTPEGKEKEKPPPVKHEPVKGMAALDMILGGSPVVSPVQTGMKSQVQTTDTDTDYDQDSFEDYESGSSDEENPHHARANSGESPDRARNARAARDRARAKRDQRRRAVADNDSSSNSNRSSLEAPLRAESNLHQRQRRAQMSHSQASSPHIPLRGSRERDHRRERVETHAHGHHAYVDRGDDSYERASLAALRSPRSSPRSSYSSTNHGDSYAQRSPSRMSSRGVQSPQTSLERRIMRGNIANSSRQHAGSPPRGGADYYPHPLTLRDRSSSAGSMSSGANYEPAMAGDDDGGGGHWSPTLNSKPRSRPGTIRRKSSSLRRSSARYSNATIGSTRDTSHPQLPLTTFYDAPPADSSPSHHHPLERAASLEKLHSLQRSHTDQTSGNPSPKLRSRKLNDRKYHTYGHKQARRTPGRRMYPHVIQQQQQQKLAKQRERVSSGRARAASSSSPPLRGTSPPNTAPRRYPASSVAGYRDRGSDPTTGAADPSGAAPLSPLSPIGGPHGAHSLPHTPLSSSRTSNPHVHGHSHVHAAGSPPPPLQLSRSHLSRSQTRSQYYRGSPHSSSSTASSHGGYSSPSSQPHTRPSAGGRRNVPSSRASAYHASMQARSVPLDQSEFMGTCFYCLASICV